MRSWIAVLSVGVVLMLAPPEHPNCDTPSFRRVNPQLCAPFPFPDFSVRGGGGGQDRGIIGGILGRLPGIGGLF
jgi:hypothetical protein